jgi:molybdopterin converting factor subunit 1
MSLKVKLYATLKERAGKGDIDVSLDDGMTVKQLRERIATEHPALAELVNRSVVSINREFAFNSDRIFTSDEVALFPPVSGG